MLDRAGPRKRGALGGLAPLWQVVSLGLNGVLLLLLVSRWRTAGPAAKTPVTHVGDLNARLLEVERRVEVATRSQTWLTIGIPTVARKGYPNYLNHTLVSLLEELPLDSDDLWSGQVQVLVMNNDPDGHPEFEQLRARAAEGGDAFAIKARRYIAWLDNPGTCQDPTPDAADPDDLNNPTSRPGRHVRKQTCDLLTLLNAAKGRSRFYLFMEDDFEVCPHALRALQVAAAKASRQQITAGWAALRVSYGMNGLLLHDADIPSLQRYLWEHITLLPPDLLWPEWAGQQVDAQGRKRPYVVYRYNLFRHMGEVSSFAVRPDRAAWPGCFAPMAEAWSLATGERYRLSCNRFSDLTPCQTAIKRRQRGGTEGNDALGLDPGVWLDVQVDWAPASKHAARAGRKDDAWGRLHIANGRAIVTDSGHGS